MRKASSPKRRRGDYEVGKGRPPESTQWKPGQSGNPKGRPKGAKNLATIFHEALQQKFQIEERGKSRMITAREGIVIRLVNQALKGDIKATAFVLAKEPEIARQLQPIEKISANASPDEAAKVYQWMIKRVGG
jgi:Family of unknown function (DUF5681)